MTGGPILFDDALKETSVRVTVAVLADDSNTWYAMGTLSHPAAGGIGDVRINSGASALISAGATLSVLSSSDTAYLDASEPNENTSVTQPYWAGGVLPQLSLQIIRHGDDRQSLIPEYKAIPNIAGLMTQAYSGLNAVFAIAGQLPLAVALYLVGNTYFGIARTWLLDHDSPGAESQSAFMLSLYLQPQRVHAPSKPHGLEPGEAVEAARRPARLVRALRILANTRR
jgi:hypothetical protein